MKYTIEYKQKEFLTWNLMDNSKIHTLSPMASLIVQVIKDGYYLEKDRNGLNWVRNKYINEFKTNQRR